MWKFLKRVVSDSKGAVTVVTLDEENPDTTETFYITKKELIAVVIFFLVSSFILTVGLFYATPLHKMYEQRLDDNFRNEILSISERVESLQDSLMAREVQLNDLKIFIRNVPDTTFNVNVQEHDYIQIPGSNWAGGVSIPTVNTFDMMTREEIMAFSKLSRSENFPSFLPVNGVVTQGFSPSVGHYGVDVSAQTGSEFRAIADGSVLYTGWTVNFGYVVFVQHNDGFVSVYKHAASLYVEQGDFILKGTVLGTVGDRGVLSSGSHLHFEIWADGIPQNPLFYLND